jgi:hypothetical protein
VISSGEQKWPKEAIELHEQLLVHWANFVLEKFVGLQSRILCHWMIVHPMRINLQKEMEEIANLR